jgi:hypothetical protein
MNAPFPSYFTPTPQQLHDAWAARASYRAILLSSASPSTLHRRTMTADRFMPANYKAVLIGSALALGLIGSDEVRRMQAGAR